MTSEKELENLKDRVFFGDKNSTWPTAVKYQLTEQTRKTIDQFDKEMSLSGKKIGTRTNYLKCVRNLLFYLGGNKKMTLIGLENLTKEDLVDFFTYMLESGKYKKGSINIHKFIIKKIYKEMDGGDEYPKIVKWIKMDNNIEKALPKNLISEDEIKRLIEIAGNNRDKAVIITLAETGGRVSEVMNLNISDLSWLFDEKTKTPIIRVRLVDIKGHTGERWVELFDSVPYIKKWLEEHPDKRNPEAPLFISLGHGTYGKRLTRAFVGGMLKTLGKRAGLYGKVTLNPHSFRHRRLTEWGKFMTKFELSKSAGHTMSSKMSDIYIHLESDDIASRLRQQRGLAPIESSRGKGKSVLRIKTCEECGDINPGTAMFCGKCQAPLDEKLMEEHRKKIRYEKIMKQAEKDQRFDGILKLLEEIMSKPPA